MLCERCNKNPATMHYTQVINGQVSEYHLCEKCAREEKMTSDFSDFDIFNMFSPKKVKSESSLICPNCKTTLSEFRKHGIAGCATCYDVFSSVIEPILLQTQGTKTHLKPKAEKKEETKKEKITRLENALKEAVKKEEYEKAASLRDEIKLLKEEE